MLNWIHHLLEPHCPVCVMENESKRICQSCETLKSQLEIVNFDKKILLERIIELTRPVVPTIEAREPIDRDEIRPRTIPWEVRKNMLEAEDRKKAQVIRAAAEEAKKAKDIKRGPSGGLTADIPQNQSIEELEKELGIEQEGA